MKGDRRTSPEAYDVLLRGNELFLRFTSEDNARARDLYREAMELDPSYARAHANLALTYSIDVQFRWTENREESVRLGFASAEEARRLDESLPQVHFTLANLHGADNRWELSYQSARRAVELEPSYSDGWAILAGTTTFIGDLDEAKSAIDQAMRLNPNYSYVYLWLEGRILFLMGRLEEARIRLEESVSRNPAFDQGHILLSAIYGALGRVDDARWQAEEALALRPDFSIADYLDRGFRNPEHHQRFADGLRRAGLPE